MRIFLLLIVCLSGISPVTNAQSVFVFGYAEHEAGFLPHWENAKRDIPQATEAIERGAAILEKSILVGANPLIGKFHATIPARTPDYGAEILIDESILEGRMDDVVYDKFLWSLLEIAESYAREISGWRGYGDEDLRDLHQQYMEELAEIAKYHQPSLEERRMTDCASSRDTCIPYDWTVSRYLELPNPPREAVREFESSGIEFSEFRRSGEQLLLSILLADQDGLSGLPEQIASEYNEELSRAVNPTPLAGLSEYGITVRTHHEEEAGHVYLITSLLNDQLWRFEALSDLEYILERGVSLTFIPPSNNLSAIEEPFWCATDPEAAILFLIENRREARDPEDFLVGLRPESYTQGCLNARDNLENELSSYFPYIDSQLIFAKPNGHVMGITADLIATDTLQDNGIDLSPFIELTVESNRLTPEQQLFAENCRNGAPSVAGLTLTPHENGSGDLIGMNDGFNATLSLEIRSDGGEILQQADDTVSSIHPSTFRGGLNVIACPFILNMRRGDHHTYFLEEGDFVPVLGVIGEGLEENLSSESASITFTINIAD